jgi:hypothetical protein
MAYVIRMCIFTNDHSLPQQPGMLLRPGCRPCNSSKSDCLLPGVAAVYADILVLYIVLEVCFFCYAGLYGR